LKKAVAFLLSKEMNEYSLEKKKEFLMKKLPNDIVEKAISIYPVVESNINSHIQDYINSQKSNDQNFLLNFFNVGILSSVLLTTLGVNYLIDLNRNKKNDLFYKECERKINEELSKNTNQMKSEINQELGEYVTKESLKEKVQTQLTEFTQQKGLNFNLSTKTVKEEISKLKQDVDSKDKLIKELNIKIDNNKLLLKEEILKETNNLIEDNNNKLLIKIIENQDKLLMIVSKSLKNDINEKQSESPNTKDIISKTTDANFIQDLNKNNDEKLNNIINLSQELINEKKQNEIDINLDFKAILESVLSTVKDEKDKFSLIKQLKNQFSAILDANSNNDNPSLVSNINLTNKIFKCANNKLLGILFIKAGFKAESASKYIYDNKLEELSNSIKIGEDYDK
jgi:hypothetical protein